VLVTHLPFQVYHQVVRLAFAGAVTHFQIATSELSFLLHLKQLVDHLVLAAELSFHHLNPSAQFGVLIF
jgi:hypothetical protein